MVKIVLDARMINHSGIGTYIQNLIPNLANKYNLILLGNEEILSSFDWYEKVSVINFKSKIYTIWEQLELWLKIPKCHIFISPHYNVPVLKVRAKQKIVIIHDVYHLAYSHKLSIPQRIYSKYLINFAVNHFDIVVTPSKFTKSEIIKYTGVNAGKIRLLYLGFNPESISLNENKIEITRNKYKLPEKFILFVGNVKPHKNLRILLLAYDILIKKNINQKLVITGKKEGFITSDKEINSILEKNKILSENVVFTDYVQHEHLMNIYRMADVLVFPSIYEGFGIPPIESMMVGTPVVVSREASIPEICGDAALYADASNPEVMAEKIETVLTNAALKSDLILKGRRNILRFTKEKFERGWETIINENI